MPMRSHRVIEVVAPLLHLFIIRSPSHRATFTVFIPTSLWCLLLFQASYDTTVDGLTVLPEFTVTDADLVGDIIEVTCTDVSLLLLLLGTV